MRFFNTIGAAAQLQRGKQYSSIEELFKDFLGKAVRVTVKNETSEYNGKTYENLNVKRWDKTKFPELAHKFKTTDDGSNPFAGVEIEKKIIHFNKGGSPLCMTKYHMN